MLEHQFEDRERIVLFVNTQLGIDDIRKKKINNIPDAQYSIELKGADVYQLLSKEEQKQLMDFCDEGVWKNLSMRRVQHYGYEFNYDTLGFDTSKPITPIPDIFNPLLKQFSLICEKFGQGEVNQLTINEYKPGCGIPFHVDSLLRICSEAVDMEKVLFAYRF